MKKPIKRKKNGQVIIFLKMNGSRLEQKKNRTLELTSVFKDMQKGKIKIAIKVIDIFGNDTTKVIEINI